MTLTLRRLSISSSASRSHTRQALMRDPAEDPAKTVSLFTSPRRFRATAFPTK